MKAWPPDAVVNPYAPPPTREPRPFWTRLRRGVSLGWREYRSGLRRDKITPLAHIRMWLSLLIVGAITMTIATTLLSVLWRIVARKLLP